MKEVSNSWKYGLSTPCSEFEVVLSLEYLKLNIFDIVGEHTSLHFLLRRGTFILARLPNCRDSCISGSKCVCAFLKDMCLWKSMFSCPCRHVGTRPTFFTEAHTLSHSISILYLTTWWVTCNSVKMIQWCTTMTLHAAASLLVRPLPCRLYHFLLKGGCVISIWTPNLVGASQDPVYVAIWGLSLAIRSWLHTSRDACLQHLFPVNIKCI